MIGHRSFSARLTLALALLLLGYGVFVAFLGRHVASEHEQESLQRLSHGLAKHIVEHWPHITQATPDATDQAARESLLSMLMVVNPGIQVYVLDADGKVEAYIGEPGMVREHQVDLGAVRAFLGGASLPLRGSDPIQPGVPRIFSAAMFPPRAGDTRPPGYLYVVLNGTASDQVAGQLSLRQVWLGAGIAGAVGLLVTLLVGTFTFRRLTLPLLRMAKKIGDYSLRNHSVTAIEQAQVAHDGDEVRAIGNAFDEMVQRIEAQNDREQQQISAHREMIASVAHDLRTPMTALHGHLEALSSQALDQPALRERVLAAALTQSNKVRRLTQQLFELAALQSNGHVLHRERFRLDDLVADTVQKFELHEQQPPVTLHGDAPGPIDLDGDLHLIERALSNLIDNAMRHAPSDTPVRVSLRRQGGRAEILIEDGGPGLPEELINRLEQEKSLRDPPVRRTSGGIGGLGLAIAQRVAILHGGSLKPLLSTQGGTLLCLALPLAD